MAEPYFTARQRNFTLRQQDFTARVSALPRQLLLHQLAHKLHAFFYILERRAGEAQPERPLVPFGLRIEVYAGDVGYLLFLRCTGNKAQHVKPHALAPYEQAAFGALSMT